MVFGGAEFRPRLWQALYQDGIVQHNVGVEVLRWMLPLEAHTRHSAGNSSLIAFHHAPKS